MIGRVGRVKGKAARIDWLSNGNRLSCRGRDVIDDIVVESRRTYASPLQSWVEQTVRKMLPETTLHLQTLDIARPTVA